MPTGMMRLPTPPGTIAAWDAYSSAQNAYQDRMGPGRLHIAVTGRAHARSMHDGIEARSLAGGCSAR